MERTHCFACGEPTSVQCDYCLLPVCSRHGEWGTLWFTRRQGIVCDGCTHKLRAMGLWQGKKELSLLVAGSNR